MDPFSEQLHRAQHQYDNQSPEDFETEDDVPGDEFNEEEAREKYMNEKYAGQ